MGQNLQTSRCDEGTGTSPILALLPVFPVERLRLDVRLQSSIRQQLDNVRSIRWNGRSDGGSHHAADGRLERGWRTSATRAEPIGALSPGVFRTSVRIHQT